MARKKSLVIEILGNNKMGRAVRDAMGSLRSLGRFAAGVGRGIARAFKGAAIGIGAMAGALAYSAKQFAEQQQADVDLAAAIRKRGDAVDEMLLKLQAEAVAIQKETKYGDELIQSLQAQAINMGIASDEATDATKAALGLAKAYGLDVVSAMRLVTRARVGDTATLKRYGIVLDDTLDAEQKYQAILKIGQSNYSLVQEEVKTLSGRFSQFKNAIGDVVQAFGGAFVEGVDLEDLFARMSTEALEVAETLKYKLQPAFEKFSDIVKGLFAGGDDRAKAIGQLKDQWQKALDFVGPKIEAWGEAAGAAIWRGFKKGTTNVAANVGANMTSRGISNATAINQWAKSHGGMLNPLTGMSAVALGGSNLMGKGFRAASMPQFGSMPAPTGGEIQRALSQIEKHTRNLEGGMSN